MTFMTTFRSRVERNIVLTVLLCGVVPLAVVAMGSMREIEAQTLALAEKQLRDSTKTYALDVLDQIGHAEAEIKLMHLAGPGAQNANSVTAFDAQRMTRPLPRTVVASGGDALHLRVPYGDLVLHGSIGFADLFAGLGHVPYGVRRCVTLDEQLKGCEGASVDRQLPFLETSWELPLSSVYDTSLALTFTSYQPHVMALAHVDLVASALPLVILALAAIIAWFLMLQIRRLMLPLSELQEATWSVHKGDYTYRVNVRTGDEFETLGRTFNLMTARLGSSFRKMQALAEIDRLILSGSTTDDVIRHALLLADESCLNDCFVFLLGSGAGQLYALEDDQLSRREVEVRADLHPGTGALRDLLELELEQKIYATFDVIRDGSRCGLLFATGRVKLAPVETRTLSELADRVSVAATNEARANALYRQANYDVLTGLINRQAFTDRLQERIETTRRTGIRSALMFLDLDRFKQVNDTEGHRVGDELLREVGRRLVDSVRGTDVVARLGGDEFAVIVAESVSDVELAELCERVIDSVRQPVIIDRINHVVDVSVGLSLFPDDGMDTGSLLMKADVAMYKAKEHHGSAFAFFDETLNDAAEQRAQIESGLRRALAEDQLMLHFQPKLNLHTNEISQAEGLLRWPGSGLGPGQLVPVAEETGLIHQFTELLVARSAACLKRCRALHLGVKSIAINVSAQQFNREAFADHLLEMLVRYGLKGTDLELEITESALMLNMQRAARELNKLRAAGVRVALDDFGTGYSSLNMLRTLPLDTLKIDRSFVKPLLNSPQDLDMTRKIIEMARIQELDVVAEGVETTAELNVLRSLGCDHVQGFVLSPALPTEELCEFLRRRLDPGGPRLKLVATREGPNG